MKTSLFSILTLLCAITLIGISGSETFGQDVNLALKANNPKVTANQSSINEWTEQKFYGKPENAIDGELKGDNLNKIAETKNETGSWFEVDLGAYFKINRVVIYPRAEACCQWFTSGYVIVTDQPIGAVPVTDDNRIKALANFSQFLNPAFGPMVGGIPKEREISVGGSIGRYVRIQIKDSQQVQLSEIQIFGEPNAIAGYKPDPTKAWSSTATTGTGSSASSSGSASSPSTGGDSSIDPKNLARNKAVGAVAKQSTIFGWGSNSGKPELAIDGKLDGIAETKSAGTNPGEDKNAWFELDLKKNYKIDKIVITSRDDTCCINQFHSFWLIVTDQQLKAEPMVEDDRIFYSSNYAEFFKAPVNGRVEIDVKGKIGQYIRLQTKDARIELKEIEVIGEPTPVADYKPNPNKAWDKAFVTAFDPNYPNFRGATAGYLDTLQGSPKIIGVKNSGTSFDIAFQDHYGDSELIKVNTYEYERDGAVFKKNQVKSTELKGLGVFAGFAKDALGNRFIFTSERWKAWTDLVTAKVYKNSEGSKNYEELWNAKYFAAADTPPLMITGVKALMNGFKTGTSRMVAGKNSLLITTNIYPGHPYQVILDTQDTTNKNKDRAFFQSLNQHNFGQRAIFDGTDFVIMENRDHDVTVSLTKLSPDKPLPLIDETTSAEEIAKLTDQQKWERHPGPFTKRLFSVYSHTNFANHTFTELGNVEKGMNDGYLVLFAGERDWDDKMKGFTPTTEIIKTWSQPQILSPRDIGLVHVKKDFEKETANWVDKDGKLTQCPLTVDNSKLINSTGAPKTVKYQTANDGWDWVRYAPGSRCENIGERSLTTKGVKWITDFGATYKKDETTKKAIGEFTSVNHPKLVRISANKYIVLWEEWKADSVGSGQPKKEYVTTKAALVNLVGSGDQVEIQSPAVKDLGKVRLMPGDDAFEFDGKAAWAVGDSTKGKLMFYTVGADLKLNSFELEL